MLKRLALTIVLITGYFLLSACGFEFRNNKNWPPEFHTVGLDLPAHTDFTQSVHKLVQSMGSSITPPLAAPFTIKIDNIDFFHDQPPITTSNQPVSFTYIFHLTLSVENSQGQVIYGPAIYTTTQPMIVNSDQIYTNTVIGIVKPMLQQRMLNLIYDHLTSESLQEALASHMSHRYSTTVISRYRKKSLAAA